MKNLRYVLVVCLCVALLATCFLTVACDAENTPDAQTTQTVTDTLGREVTVPTKVDKVVCIGASALRLYCYVGDIDKLCGVEDFEKGNKMPVRPYSYAYKDDFAALPSCGAGGPGSKANAEAILACKPDVIFSLYDKVDEMDKLQSDTSIPVVCLSYGGADPFSAKITQSLTLIGKVMGKEARATEVNNYIASVKADLNTRAATVAEDQKPKVYLGNNTYNGSTAFTRTLLNFAPFRELGAKNVVKSIVGDSTDNNPNLDAEALIQSDPDYIFIDAANVAAFLAEKDTFDQMTAIDGGKVYTILPFNQYYTNIEIATATGYYIGKVIYPEAFSDVDVAAKFNEICSTMLGKEMDYYQKVVQGVGGVGYQQLVF